MDPISIAGSVTTVILAAKKIVELASELGVRLGRSGLELHAMQDHLQALAGLLDCLPRVQQLSSEMEQDLSTRIETCQTIMRDLDRLVSDYCSNPAAWVMNGKATITSIESRLDHCTKALLLEYKRLKLANRASQQANTMQLSYRSPSREGCHSGTDTLAAGLENTAGWNYGNSSESQVLTGYTGSTKLNLVSGGHPTLPCGVNLVQASNHVRSVRPKPRVYGV
ncbi:hypothetical protein NOR_00003 [Metarhizium rileyi]|uniref:Fungal N-terminal domain-containing protein n=1 Tax=Metarhizium rileyi (strain RCEF 4871) TaxID=1649241 RepID=A0A162M5W8_METRR|nr:hypothetical protein NOR_00003 [Metarhizium rileyi RCEF 4871]